MRAGEIKDIYMALNGVGAKRLPTRLSFVLLRNRKKMQDIVKDIETKQNELLERYGEKDENGELVIGKDNKIKVPEGEKYLHELSEVMNTDIEITLDKVTMDDIEKCDSEKYDSLTVEEISALEYMMAQEAAE